MTATREPIIRLASFGVLKCNGRVLLGRRREDDLWGLVGGKVNWGEDPLKAFIRECKEETGIDLTIGNPPQLREVVSHRVDHLTHWISIVYRVKFPREPEVITSEEHVEWNWFKSYKLPSNLFYTISLLKDDIPFM